MDDYWRQDEKIASKVSSQSARSGLGRVSRFLLICICSTWYFDTRLPSFPPFLPISQKLNEDMDDYWAGAPKKGEAAAPAAAAATAVTTEPAAEAAAEAAPAAEEVVAE
jgi:hypothetical protein